MQKGPLTGMKVVECSTWAFGPLAGVMLGDLGAQVPSSCPCGYYKGKHFKPATRPPGT